MSDAHRGERQSNRGWIFEWFSFVFFIRNFKVLLYANYGRRLAIPALGLLVSALRASGRVRSLHKGFIQAEAPMQRASAGTSENCSALTSPGCVTGVHPFTAQIPHWLKRKGLVDTFPFNPKILGIMFKTTVSPMKADGSVCLLTEPSGQCLGDRSHSLSICTINMKMEQAPYYTHWRKSIGSLLVSHR